MFEQPPQSRWSIRSLAASLLIHGAIAGVLMTATLAEFHPAAAPWQPSVRLIAPGSAAGAAPRAPARPAAFRLPASAATKRLVLPTPATEVVHVANPPPLLDTTEPPRTSPLPVSATIPVLEPAVTTGLFDESSSAVAAQTTGRPVETGTFDVAAGTSAGRARQEVWVGALTSRVEPGKGLVHGRPVSRTGFASMELAGEQVGARALQRIAVQAAGFGDAKVAQPTGRSSTRVEAPQGIEILEKPRPAYTEEARRLQIEGIVRLQVVFGAEGRIEVLRIVSGLGHGLDESAIRAAQGIRFRPAMKDGRAVSATALVQIVFQLAS